HLLKDGDRIAGAVAYWRTTGEFVVFRTKALVLATGGVGKAWKITSNSWEYTGDGHALALRAGADLIGMEFQQFHPTGMVWPPSVRGTLVTEGVRGEGGVLTNSTGARFMFGCIPELYRADTADTEEEALRWVAGDRTKSRRPPELLTRDVVARAIRQEVLEGRGSPHGGVFLDIATQRGADYIRRKLPSMYHQFKTLAGVDITREPMEVGPTCHYAMGGVRVDAETAAATVSGLFAAGEVAAGLHGANRLGGNSLSDLLVFGRRAGLGAAEYACSRSGAPQVDAGRVEQAVREATAPCGRDGESPHRVHEDLQELMQHNCAIVREQAELETALSGIDELRDRAARVGVGGSRAYDPGWHLAVDLRSLLLVAEAVARAALVRTARWGKTILVVRGAEGALEVVEEPLEPMPDDLGEYVRGATP
ncbi:MAG: FAD-binding protein, partial [Planctomycetota bacterium]